MGSDLVLRQDLEAGIVRLVFNRPDKLNALSTPMIQALESHLDTLAKEPAVRVVILGGAGDRAFVAGADIAEYRGHRPAAFIAYQLESRRVFDKLDTLPKPVIASIRGYALGGGFEIALTADVIVCAMSARLGLPEGLLGLSPGGGGTQRLTRAVGRVVASDMLLAARRISGERAFQLGLAAEVVPDDKLEEATLARARAMLQVAPLAQAEMKRLLREGIEAPLATARSLEQEVLFRLYGSRDAGEGISAFLDKRSANFRGE